MQTSNVEIDYLKSFSSSSKHANLNFLEIYLIFIRFYFIHFSRLNSVSIILFWENTGSVSEHYEVFEISNHSCYSSILYLLPYFTSNLTLPLALPSFLPYLTIHLTLPYLTLPYVLPYLTLPYHTLCLTILYYTLP